MNRRLAALAATAVLAVPTAIAFSGCGAEDAVGVDVAQAAQKTAGAKTAKYTMSIKAVGLGLPLPIALTATGVTDTSRPRMTMKLELGDIAKALGVPLGGDGVEIRIDGRRVYVKPPRLPGLTIPGGKQWVAIDLRTLAQTLGFGDLGKLLTLDAGAQVRALKATKGLKKVATENVGGAKTTHLRGTVSIADLVAALPADARPGARRALRRLDEIGGTAAGVATPFDVWIDDQNLVRRMRGSQRLPGRDGQPGGWFEMTMELHDFGAALDLERPASVWDATSAITGLLDSFGLGKTSTS